MPNKVGVNVGRILVGGRQNQSSINPDQLRHGAPPQQFRVVVIDVIYDPNELSTEEKTALKEAVRNPEFVDNMPPNSVVGKVVTSGETDVVDAPSIFYPYFQSHIMLPLVAGEHVHVIYEDFEREGTTLGRWVTRIHESRAVEDTNYTHSDRRFDTVLQPSTERTSDVADRRAGTSQQSVPSFPNGGNTNDSLTLPPSGSNNGNPYEGIYQQARASKTHEYEPVPRWTKRSDEFVIQGMNNSLVVLGQDRTGPATRPQDTKDKKTFAGMVDVVVGRGRFPITNLRATTVPPAAPTTPFIVQNSRSKKEVDKTPKLRNRIDNRKEGDPDLKTDAARLSIFMQSELDKNLKIQEGSDGITYPDNTLKPAQPAAVASRFNLSYVLGKADHIRFVARKGQIPDPDGGDIKGTILLLREGTKDSDLAYFFIDETGKVQIEAKEIYLGKATQKNEPYIKWTEFKKAVDALQAQISHIAERINTMGSQLSSIGAGSMCVPFTPDPAVAGIGSVVGSTASSVNIQAEKQKVEAAVPAAKSIKIFGE